MIQPGTLVQGRYEIVSLIGKGGMGAVYEAIDHRLKSKVALKQTLVSDEKLDRAFEREAQILASLRHPALTKVSDYFTEGNGKFLVMEFIPGKDLGEMLVQQGSAFPVSDVLDWGESLLDALEYLHTQSIPIIHRDIKPQNLKLTPRGEVLMLDFGLAKGSTMPQSRVTSGGSIFGYTPRYAPVEQIQGTGTDPRSDLYSLAATLYHLITNVSPTDALARAAAVLNGQPDPLAHPHDLNPQVPLAVSQLLMRTMSLGAGERPESAAAMRDALRAARSQSDDMVTMIPPSPSGHPVPFPIPDPQSSQSHPPQSPSSAYTGETIVFPPDPSAVQPDAPPIPPPYTPPPHPSSAPRAKANKTRKYCLWTLAGVGVLSILACAGIFGLAFLGSQIEDEKVAETSVATLVAEQDGSLNPLRERLEQRAETATAQAAVVAVGSDEWVPLLVETFDENIHEWPESDEDNEFWVGSRRLGAEGTYRWEMRGKQDFRSYVWPTTNPIADFWLGTDASQLSGPDDNSYGLMFRMQKNQNSFYAFRIGNDQTFNIGLLLDGEWSNLVEWTDTDAIVPGVMNKLAVAAEGEDFSFWINEEMVAQISDDTLDDGRNGLVIWLDEDEEAVFEFDNFEVHGPSDSDLLEVSDTSEPTEERDDGGEPSADFHFYESFDEDQGRWSPEEEDDEFWTGEKRIVDGLYRWSGTAKKNFVAYEGPEDMPEVTNFTLTTNARRVEGPEPSSLYGLVFRRQTDTDSFYTFMAADDQTFKVSLSQGSEWTTLIDWTETEAIVPGDMNTLTVSAEGDYFTFSINGQSVGEMTDSTLLYGKAGLIIGLDEGTMGTFQFDDFEILIED